MKNKKTQEEIDKINELKKADEKFMEEQGWKFKDYDPEIPWFAQEPELQWDEEEECFFAIVFDAEIDPFKVKFHNDHSLHIETEGMTYITMDFDMITTMRELMMEAQDLYQVMREEEEDEETSKEE